MGMSELAVLLLGALLSGPSDVQYRCPKPEGGAIFQRTPCAGAAATAEGAAPPVATRPVDPLAAANPRMSERRRKALVAQGESQ